MPVRPIDIFSPGDRQQMIAEQMMAAPAIDRSQWGGRQVPEYGLAHGLVDAGQKLAAAWMMRRAGKKQEAEEAERRRQQALILADMGGTAQDMQPGFMGPPRPDNPYATGQQAIEAGIDPALIEAYMAQKMPTGRNNQFGVVNPSDFTPESMRTFSQSGDYGDLAPVERDTFNRVNPRDYTPESLARYMQTGNLGDLVRVAPYQFRDTPGGGTVALDPISGQQSGVVRTPEEGTAEAATRTEAEALARARGEAEGKALGAYLNKATTAQGMLEILDIAEPIIEVATGSATGAMRDRVASWFGVSTEGAQGIAQLQPLQAALMLAMPRMEGPQSDRDTQLYREAAGQIGDPSVPRETKLAALQLIRRLQQQYTQLGAGVGAQLPQIIPNSSTPQMQQGGANIVDFNAL